MIQHPQVIFTYIKRFDFTCKISYNICMIVDIKSYDGNLLHNRFAYTFFKFSLVRNPWDRVISLYEWLKMHKTHPQRTTDSFKDWLLSITPNCNSYKTQSWYLNETMDFVGR